MPVVLGSAMLVNAETAGHQDMARVTVLEGGGWVVTWESDDQDGSSTNIYQQLYDKNGQKKGGAILFAKLEGSPDDVSAADFVVI